MIQQTVTTLISNEEARAMLGMSKGGLDKLRIRDATFPKPIKTSNARQARVRFDPAEIEAWMRARQQQLQAPQAQPE